MSSLTVTSWGGREKKKNNCRTMEVLQEKKIVWILTIVQLLEGTRCVILLIIKSVNHENDYETIILM